MAKLTADFNDDGSELIRRLAAQTGREPDEVIKRALALYDYALNSADPSDKKTVTLKIGGKDQDITL